MRRQQLVHSLAWSSVERISGRVRVLPQLETFRVLLPECRVACWRSKGWHTIGHVDGYIAYILWSWYDVRVTSHRHGMECIIRVPSHELYLSWCLFARVSPICLLIYPPGFFSPIFDARADLALSIRQPARRYTKTKTQLRGGLDPCCADL